jgi:hypothetical protein
MPEQIPPPNQEAGQKLTPADKAAQEAERKKRRKERFQQRTLLSDCGLMLRYALDESCQVPPELMENVAKVDALLIAAGTDPLSEISKELQELQRKTKTDLPTENIDDLLLKLHNALSNLVAPATALSLRETDPELKWLGMPHVGRTAIFAGLIFMVWFLIAVPRPELPKSNTGEAAQTTATPTPSPTASPTAGQSQSPASLKIDILTASPSPTPTRPPSPTPGKPTKNIFSWLRSFIRLIKAPACALVAGAGLGACFYTLIKLQPYLENRSFDPKYNSAYITRFVIGMVAGVILAYMWTYLFPQGQKGSQIALPSFTSGIIGILGGFSAEAVEQILQRIVEVLLSLVRGDNSGQVQAKADAQQNAKFADVRDKLDALDKAKSDPTKFQAEMDAVKALLKRSGS